MAAKTLPASRASSAPWKNCWPTRRLWPAAGIILNILLSIDGYRWECGLCPLAWTFAVTADEQGIAGDFQRFGQLCFGTSHHPVLPFSLLCGKLVEKGDGGRIHSAASAAGPAIAIAALSRFVGFPKRADSQRSSSNQHRNHNDISQYRGHGRILLSKLITWRRQRPQNARSGTAPRPDIPCVPAGR